MGKAVALALAEEGAKIVVAELDPMSGEATAAEITKAGGVAMSIQTDLAHVDQIERLFSQAVHSYGTVDILVNNAGIGIVGDLVDFTEEQWDLQLDINLKALFFTTQAAARVMIAKGRGKIVNFASTAAFVSSSNVHEVPYDVSKGGVRSLTISSAYELAPHGINVNAVAPGSILTDLNRARYTPEKVATTVAKIPIGRLGTPADLVGPVLFLCSEDADYVTGHVLVVDGGWILH
jgi:2-deoxy-D-gluconate 3-dehydrogenase